MYSAFLKTQTDLLNAEELNTFVKIYIEEWTNKRGKGHIKTITSIWKGLTGKQDIANSIIVPYLSAVLLGYTRKGQFDLMGYFNQVFLKLIDLWGFIMSYSTFLETGYTNERINNLIITYLYRMPTKPIDIDNLVNDLQDLF